MQKKTQKQNSTYSFLKSLKNRLSFAFSKKKGFLSNENQKIEVLEEEEIEVLEEEVPTTQILKSKNNTIELLDIEEPKLRRKVVHLKPVVKKKIQFASYALSAACVVLLVTSFVLGNNITKVNMKKILYNMGIYTEEVKTATIESDDYDNEGSWRIKKTSKWIGKGKAQAEVELTSIIKKSSERARDVIIVLDKSESMEGVKINTALEDITMLINSILLDNSNNRIAIIDFSSNATIESNFTNNKDALLEVLDDELLSGCTNYNSALKKVDELMEGYSSQEEKDVVVLFLTDGLPNEEKANNIGTYKLLKDKYPYIKLQGIQYEMGSWVAEDIRNISDRQWIAKTTTLASVLIEATISPIRYQEMILTDTISEYFTVASISNIKVTKGEVSLVTESNTQKVIWDLGEEKYYTGTTAKMTIDLSMKEEYLEEDDFFPVSKNEKVEYKLIGESESAKNSTNTPVLKSAYKILYDANPPSGCNISDSTIEKHNVFKIVNKKTEVLSCEGYLFQGWKIDGEDDRDITYLNENSFLMPSHDVHIRGTWAKPEIDKAVDGTIYERTTLYKVIESEATTNGLAKKYTGEHQDTMNESGDNNIYHWYASTDANASKIMQKYNVIFAGNCWQMFRTTDTGGVKMLYNGEQENGKCLTTRGKHVGETDRNYISMSASYYYGTDYNYDKENNKFSISGDVSTGSVGIGKYTCRSTSETGTCSTLYVPVSYDTNSNSYHSVYINNTAEYYEIGAEVFTSSSKLLADAGYMTNKAYGISQTTRTGTKTIFSNKTLSLNYWYADDISWNEERGQYELENPFMVSSNEEYSTLKNKYTFYSTETSGEKVNYIVHTSEAVSYYIALEEGNLLSNYEDTCYYGSGYLDNGDGTYSITNASTFDLFDWSSNYSKLTSKYLCLSSNCQEVFYITSSTISSITHLSSNNKMKIANSFTYEDGTYHLSSDGEIFRALDLKDSNKSKLNTNHYTCWNEEGTCTSISFYYYLDGNTFYYIKISSGKNITDAINELLFADDVNKNDSSIKAAVDRWYRKYIKDSIYEDYIEDTIYCNDRSISDYGGWGNNGQLDKYLRFRAYVSSDSSLRCTNETDKFSINNPKAQLTYPIGLMTIQELRLINKPIYKNTYFWTMSPGYSEFGQYSRTTYAYRVPLSGTPLASLLAYTMSGYRPVISLKPNVTFESGDGSMDDPYVVDMDSFSN